MPLAKGSRGVRGLIYVDENLVEHTVLLAYLGDKVVWDGHVHQTVQMPVTAATARLLAPVISADALAEPGVMAAIAEIGAVAVRGASSVLPSVMPATAAMLVPELHADQTLDIETAAAAAVMLEPIVRVVFGVTPGVMTATAAMLVPDVHAGAVPAVGVAEAYAVLLPPVVGSFAAVSPGVMTAAAVMLAPVVHADHRVPVGVATAAASLLAPSVKGSSTVMPGVATAAAQMLEPEVRSTGPAFVSATPGTSSASVTVPAVGSLVVAAYNNAAGDPTVTCSGGVTLTKAASSSQVTLFYAVGVAAGTYTITNTSGGSFKSFVAGVYSGVTAASAGTLASGTSTTPSVTPAGSGLLAVAAFRGGSIPAGTTSNGDIRGRQATTSNDLMLVDRVSAPVSLSLSSSTVWAACAVWLT